MKLDLKAISALVEELTTDIDLNTLEKQGVIKKSKKNGYWVLLDASRLPEAVWKRISEPVFEKETGTLSMFKVIEIK